jgi:hypothetical protein
MSAYPFDLLNRCMKFPVGSDEWNLLQALCRLAANGGGGGGSGSEFVYREGGVAGPGVFTSWTGAYTAAFATGIPATIFVDNRFGVPVMPAGTYDLTQIAVMGWRVAPTGGLGIILQDGAKLSGIERFGQTLSLVSQSSQPVITVGAGQTVFGLLEEGAGFVTDPLATAPFVKVLAGGQFGAVTQLGGSLVPNTQPVVDIDLGGSAILIAGEGSSAADNAFSGAGVAQVQTLSTSASVGRTQLMVPPTNFQLNRGDQAELLTFDTNSGPPPGTTLLWNVPAWGQPETQAALQNLVRRATVFVLAPGAVVGGQVFDDLQKLCQAAQQAGPGPRVIWTDASLAPVPGQIDIPPGTYITGGPTTVIGDKTRGLAPTTLNLADGALFPPGAFDFEDVLLQGNASGPGNVPFSFNATTGQLTVSGESNGCGIKSLGAAPVVSSQAAADLRLVLHGHAGLLTGASPAVSCGPGATLDIEGYEKSQIQTNTLAYDAASTGTISLDGNASLDYAQPSVPGGAILAGAVPLLEIEGSFTQKFTSAPGFVYAFTHNLSSQYVHVVVYDATNAEVAISLPIPDSVVATSENVVTLNLTSFGLFPGTWTVAIRR